MDDEIVFDYENELEGAFDIIKIRDYKVITKDDEDKEVKKACLNRLDELYVE